MTERGGQGVVHWHPQFLANQLTLFQLGGADSAHPLLLAPQILFPSGIADVRTDYRTMALTPELEPGKRWDAQDSLVLSENYFRFSLSCITRKKDAMLDDMLLT